MISRIVIFDYTDIELTIRPSTNPNGYKWVDIFRKDEKICVTFHCSRTADTEAVAAKLREAVALAHGTTVHHSVDNAGNPVHEFRVNPDGRIGRSGDDMDPESW